MTANQWVMAACMVVPGLVIAAVYYLDPVLDRWLTRRAAARTLAEETEAAVEQARCDARFTAITHQLAQE